MAGKDDVEVRWGANTKGAEDGAKRVAQAVEGVRAQVQRLNDNIKTLTQGVTFSYLAKQVGDFVRGIADLGDATEDTAAQLAVSTERIGELAYIAASAGDSLQSMAMGMQRLAYNSQKAIAGSDTEADAFKRLGVNIRDAAGNVKSIDQLLMETADSFAAHADGAEKVALAFQLFGRTGVNMIPLLNEGSAAFEELNEVARRTGSVLSGATVAGMMQVHQSLAEVNASFMGLGVAIFNTFQPAIEGVLNTVASLIQGFTHWISRSYETGGAAKWLAMMVTVVVSAVIALVGAFELLFTVASAVLDTIAIGLGLVGQAVAYGLAGNWAAATVAAEAAGAAMEKTWADTGARVVEILGGYTENIKKMWADTLDPPREIIVGSGKLPAFASPTDTAAANAKLNTLKQQLREVQATFEGVFSNIIQGMDRAFSGLITGTMSWQDALLTVADSIWSTFAKLVEDWVAKWLAGEALMLMTHESANAAKIASDLATESMATSKLITNAVKAIFVDSKTTAAGVTANLAPTLGPLAIPAGLAAGATVAGLASFDVGSWNLPRDQIAKVHKGEMIVPSRGGAADAVRGLLSGQGGGGGTVINNNFNGPVFDKAGLARTMVETMQRNPSLRPKW